MANEPEITVTGNVTTDPELKVTTNGASWARFTIASTPRSYDRNSGQWIDGQALFLQCTAWRGLGNNIVDTLHKGMRVVVTGKLRQRHWESDQGEKRSAFSLDVEDIGPSLKWATAQVTKAKAPDVQSPSHVSSADEQPPF